MELILLVLTAAMVGMLIASLGRDARDASPYAGAPRPEPRPARLPKPVPAGHQIYETYLTVAYTEVYLEEALGFAHHPEQALRLQREALTHDPHAI